MEVLADSRITANWAERFLSENGYATKDAFFSLIRERPWSRVSRVSTSHGDVYLKQSIPAFAAEAPLLGLMQEQSVSGIPVVISGNANLRAFLMEDAGLPMRDNSNVGLVMEAYERALEQCAEIQIKMATHLDAMLAAKVPDRRLNNLPRLYSELIAQENMLLQDGMDKTEINLLRELEPKITEISNSLSGYQIPETIEHGDMHTGNILLKNGRSAISDWGDAVISHPFFTIAESLHRAQYSHELKENDDLYVSLRKAYLQKWLSFEPINRLEEAFELALRLRPAIFALSFSRIKKCPGMELPNKYTGYLADSLRRLATLAI